MIIIPAIDLMGGECVRLIQGSYDSVQSYSRDPARVARSFAAAGARWIHLVDLDAARGKGANNRTALRQIREAVDCRIEVGGGIRTEDDARALLEMGTDRLVLGTILAAQPERVAQWRSKFGGVFWAGIDALSGRVRVAGWEQETGLEDLELAERAEALGLAGIVYTSISRDGTLEGPDIERTNRVALAGLPVILSGGIGTSEHVERVYRERDAGVEGIIIGKAIYERQLDLAELIRRFSP